MTKILNLAGVFLFLLFLAGCTHAVYQADVEPSNFNTIAANLEKRCQGDCELEKCWKENPGMMVCDVQFSFTTDYTQRVLLVSASQDLKKKGLNVGFCSASDFPTQMVGAFIGGMTGAVLNHSLGGGGDPVAMGSSFDGTNVGNEGLENDPCFSEPVVE
jgi:hypothetical protein